MKNNSALKTILLAGLIAGTLDITAAIVFLGNGQIENVLRYVASGFFGKDAFGPNPVMPFYGALFHYLIAMSIAVCYFYAFPRLSFLKFNILLNAILIGVAAWLVTNLLIVPNSQIGRYPSDWMSILKNMAILIVCIGLPISIFTSVFYSKARSD